MNGKTVVMWAAVGVVALVVYEIVASSAATAANSAYAQGTAQGDANEQGLLSMLGGSGLTTAQQSSVNAFENAFPSVFGLSG